MSVDHEFVKNL